MTVGLLAPEMIDLDKWIDSTTRLARWIDSGFRSDGNPLPEGFREIPRLEDHLADDTPATDRRVQDFFDIIKRLVGDTGRMELLLEPNSDGTHRVVLRSRLITKG